MILTRTQAASTAMPEAESLERLAATGATLVLHLAIRRTRELAGRLADFYGPDCPVAVVSRATQPDELVLRGTLADIGDQVETAGLRHGRGDHRRSGAGRRGLRRLPPLRHPDRPTSIAGEVATPLPTGESRKSTRALLT